MEHGPKYKIGDIVCTTYYNVIHRTPYVVYDVYADQEADNREGGKGDYHKYILESLIDDPACILHKVARYQYELLPWSDAKQEVIEALQNRISQLEKI